MYLHCISTGIADIENQLTGIIKERTKSYSSLYNYEVMCSVKRARVLLMIGIIVIPANVFPASFVYSSRLLTKTVNDVVFRKTVFKIPVAVRCEIRKLSL